MVIFVSLILLWTESCTGAKCESGVTLSMRGTLKCEGKPIPYTHIRIVRNIGFVRHIVASSYTDAEGRYILSGSPVKTLTDKPDEPWTVLLYPFFRNKRANNDRNRLYFSPSFGTSLALTPGKTREFDFDMESSKCTDYMNVMTELQDFEDRVGYETPAVIKFRTKQTNDYKSPVTDYTDIYVPKRSTVTKELIKHELAHALRNIFDGKSAHIKDDAKDFGGFESHSCEKATNPQFAFNEGWACYWAEECMDSDEKGDMDVEGNIAAALRSLQKRCRTSDHDMWAVLKQNSGKIHSFAEYMDGFQDLVGCS